MNWSVAHDVANWDAVRCRTGWTGVQWSVYGLHRLSSNTLAVDMSHL
jgi:hypothetical protein